MKRRLVMSGAMAAAMVLTACAESGTTAPTTIPATAPPTTATPVATTQPTATTTPATTEPPKPVVTAVPVVMPIEQAVTTTVPPTTAPPTTTAQSPIAPDNPASSWTGTARSGNTTPLEVGWIEVPKIGIRYTAYRAADEYSERAVNNAINLGPTFWGTTTKPGEPGNVVIAGHRVSHGAFFRNIDQLTPGDEIIVAGLDGVSYTYLVEQTIITGPNDLSIVQPRNGATITLFACHPPGSIRQRIVVYGNLKTA